MSKTTKAVLLLTILLASLAVTPVYAYEDTGFETGDFSEWDGAYASGGQNEIVNITTSPQIGRAHV